MGNTNDAPASPRVCIEYATELTAAPTIKMTVMPFYDHEASFPVEVAHDSSVVNLKEAIAEQTGMECDKQTLYLSPSKRPLIGDKSLIEYELSDEEIVYMEKGLVGGGCCVCFVPCPPPCCRKRKRGKDKERGNYY